MKKTERENDVDTRRKSFDHSATQCCCWFDVFFFLSLKPQCHISNTYKSIRPMIDYQLRSRLRCRIFISLHSLSPSLSFYQLPMVLVKSPQSPYFCFNLHLIMPSQQFVVSNLFWWKKVTKTRNEDISRV